VRVFVRVLALALMLVLMLVLVRASCSRRCATAGQRAAACGSSRVAQAACRGLRGLRAPASLCPGGRRPRRGVVDAARARERSRLIALPACSHCHRPLGARSPSRCAANQKS
jgi:hypothetical protein